MKKYIPATILMHCTLLTAIAQNITISSISGDGIFTFQGAENGSTATVEWVSHLADISETNWNSLTNILVSSSIVTSTIPISGTNDTMFFRIVGVPDDSYTTNGLLAYYPFNGNALDYSGNENHGIVYGATLVSGINNQAYSFDGKDDFIDFGSNLGIGYGTTINIWVKYTPGELYSLLSGFNTARYYFGIDWTISDAGSLGLSYGAGGYDSYEERKSFGSAPAVTEGWHMLTIILVSFDEVLAFVDGEALSMEHISGTASSVNWNTSYRSSARKDFFHAGTIDQLRVFNRQLSESDIKGLYTSNQ